MNYIIQNIRPKDSQPEVIANGTKLMMINFRNVRIIDSHTFIPIALSQFSSAFGIDEHKKGFFPHLFNTLANQSYVGAYPDRSFYTPQFFSSKKLEEFNTWYDRVKDQTFDFQHEFQEYCWSDVYLLAAGCIKFRQVIMNLTQPHSIDPFEKSITIASLCHLIYRSMLLQPKTLPYIPERGYSPDKNSSYKSVAWIHYIQSRDNVHLQYAGSVGGGEKQIGPYYLDGYDSANNIGYEFHGCYFHGCPKCFTPETLNRVQQCTMKSIYARHCSRIEYLKHRLTQLIEIWECDFDKINDPLLDEILDKEIHTAPLQPRAALFGGRTNAIRLHYKVQQGEEIHYVDFTSLYPYVQKYCRYPVGHPEIITDNFDSDINNYFGLIKCKILPPRKLFLPVLPTKINNKLVFALCRSCAQDQMKECSHDDDERTLNGTWVLNEVQKAVELGYQIKHIYEIWHWDNTEKYDVETKSGGLFTDYINMFLKGKQEASGFPSNVQTSTEQNEYKQQYLEREGIELDLSAIEHNPSKR